jgi:hypothetical protein
LTRIARSLPLPPVALFPSGDNRPGNGKRMSSPSPPEK